MPACPNCGTKVQSPARMFSVIVEPKEGERGLTERKVGMYQCPKCQTKFPTVVSRQRYLIIAEDQLKQIQADLKELKKQYEELQKTLEKTRRESEIRQLEIKVRSLEEQIDYLKKEKGELEQKVAKLT